ncbi:hypothetical protein LIA77_05229 [Sarocladium implicatum]|nr:hypothetical protein LIA77_05229 [Sarocladium implicatum]
MFVPRDWLRSAYRPMQRESVSTIYFIPKLTRWFLMKISCLLERLQKPQRQSRRRSSWPLACGGNRLGDEYPGRTRSWSSVRQTIRHFEGVYVWDMLDLTCAMTVLARHNLTAPKVVVTRNWMQYQIHMMVCL